MNPQLQNSYSYGGNNPITNKDPSGRCIWDACVGEAAVALMGVATLAAQYGPQISAAMPGLTPYVDQTIKDWNSPDSTWVDKGFIVASFTPTGKVGGVIGKYGDDVLKSWRGTNMSVEKSIEYHLAKHGEGLTASEYTNKAKMFYDKAMDNIKEYTVTATVLKDEAKSLGIKITNKLSGEAGIFDQAGKIVTYIQSKTK